MNIHSVFVKLALVLATGGGAGFVPVAPGTAGSALALPMAYVFYRWGGVGALVATLVVLLPLSIWSAQRADDYFQRHDASFIVVDEIVGQLIAVAMVPCIWPNLVVAFGWFRLFDSIKPFPAGWIDRQVKGGVGVVLDDVVAGVYAGIVTSFCVYSHAIAWVLQQLNS